MSSVQSTGPTKHPLLVKVLCTGIPWFYAYHTWHRGVVHQTIVYTETWNDDLALRCAEAAARRFVKETERGKTGRIVRDTDISFVHEQYTKPLV